MFFVAEPTSIVLLTREALVIIEGYSFKQPNINSANSSGRAHECSIIDLNNKGALNYTHQSLFSA
jgi:hypothetical protein